MFLGTNRIEVRRLELRAGEIVSALVDTSLLHSIRTVALAPSTVVFVSQILLD